MKKYYLSKTEKGKKFLYEVKDEEGNVISSRTSKREYVACTINGECYFGKLSLVGKGSHGQFLREAMTYAAYDEYSWLKEKAEREREIRYIIRLEKTLDHPKEWMDKFEKEIWDDFQKKYTDKEMLESIEMNVKYGKHRLHDMQVAYLR